MRTEDRIIIATRHPRYSSITLFFSLVLLFAGFHGASAETPGQPGTNSTATDSGAVSAETTTQQNPSAPAAQLEPKTDKAPQPVAQTETGERLGPQVDPCFTVRVAGDNWMDQVHGYVQDHTCEPAVWFDTFFVKDHVLLDLRPGTLITFRNSVRWTEGHSVAYVHDLHLEWELPQWQKMLKNGSYISIRDLLPTNILPSPVSPSNRESTGKREPENPSLGCERICMPGSVHWSVLTAVSNLVSIPMPMSGRGIST